MPGANALAVCSALFGDPICSSSAALLHAGALCLLIHSPTPCPCPPASTSLGAATPLPGCTWRGTWVCQCHSCLQWWCCLVASVAGPPPCPLPATPVPFERLPATPHSRRSAAHVWQVIALEQLVQVDHLNVLALFLPTHACPIQPLTLAPCSGLAAQRMYLAGCLSGCGPC